MSKGIEIIAAGTLLLLLFSSGEGLAQDSVPESLRFMFYNVENLFDTVDDTVTDDDEFLPGGVRRWTRTRYNAKINALSRVIIAAGGWEAPAIAGFCEVENRKVVEDLIFRTPLAKHGYAVVHDDSPDPRGIDVCMIYRRELVKVLDYKYFIPADPGPAPFRSRSVLYAKCLVLDDTVHLFLNHWPSRRGGVLAGESLREAIADMLRAKADSVAASSGGDALIIFAGDFNAAPSALIMESLTGHYRSGLSVVNLSASLPSGSGTYRYMGVWEMIDQVLVSESFLPGKGRLQIFPGSLKVFSDAFLLTDDSGYPGPAPFSGYRGFKYQGGYSDHLPVIFDITSGRLF
jgi:hypothetical protein